ncbi:response regulator [Candidatus Woesearchaeota archaeon]|nr:response regulator [Candidatus Woesearchaeota archaeon]
MPQKDKFKILVAGKDHKLSEGLVKKLESGDYDVEQAVNGKTALEKAMPNLSNNGFSPYDLIIYDSELTDLSFSAFLERVKVEDKYLPILVTGPENTELASMAVNAGALHYISKSRQDIIEVLTDHILKRLTLSADVGEVTVIHIGNSASSFDDKYQGLNNLERAIEVCIEHKRLGGKLIITTGDGVFGETQRRYLRHHENAGSVKKSFNGRIKQAVEINTKNIYLLFKGAAQYISPDDFVRVSDELLKNKIALVPFPPVPVYRKYNIPFDDPAVRSISISEFYRAKRLIILGDIAGGGLYSYDHHKGFEGGAETWLMEQKDNIIYKNTILASGLLEGYNGTDAKDGKGYSLLTERAISYFLEKTESLQEIVVVPIDPHQMFVRDPDLSEELGWRHVVNKDLKFISLQKQLEGAFKGECPYGVKILRPYPSEKPRIEEKTDHQIIREDIFKKIF